MTTELRDRSPSDVGAPAYMRRKRDCYIVESFGASCFFGRSLTDGDLLVGFPYDWVDESKRASLRPGVRFVATNSGIDPTDGSWRDGRVRFPWRMAPAAQRQEHEATGERENS
jgi:hypothetical protein